MQYIVDSFQVFFPCDLQLTKWVFKEGLHRNIHTSGRERFSMPIVYADCTRSTIKKDSHLRKYAFPAEMSACDSDTLGWSIKKNGIEIPSENFFVDFSILGDTIRITPEPSSDYHLEYKYNLETKMDTWANWFGVYLSQKTAISLLKYLLHDVRLTQPAPRAALKPLHETKQTFGKREELYYFVLQPDSYYMTYETFPLAHSFLIQNGFSGDHKGIFYKKEYDFIEPEMKIGYVHTQETDGDFSREPQIAIKLAQKKKVFYRNTTTNTQHTTHLRGSLAQKGDLSYIDVPKIEFVHLLYAACKLMTERTKISSRS